MSASAITIDEVMDLHRRLIEQFGGDDTDRAGQDRECVDSSQKNAFQGAYYLGGGQTNPLHVAGLMLFYLAKRHCFTDGNKRIAWAVCADHLLRHGLEVVAEEDEVVQMVLDVADGRTDRDQVIRWLAQVGRLAPARRNPIQ